jgi:hypothetical protein
MNRASSVGTCAFSGPLHPALDGPVAQLGERLVRNEEASGSIPLRSTIFQQLSDHPSHNHVPFRSNSSFS